MGIGKLQNKIVRGQPAFRERSLDKLVKVAHPLYVRDGRRTSGKLICHLLHDTARIGSANSPVSVPVQHAQKIMKMAGMIRQILVHPLNNVVNFIFFRGFLGKPRFHNALYLTDH